MEQSDLIVRRIKDGTVIDHINEGKGLKVLEALDIDGKLWKCYNNCIEYAQWKIKEKRHDKVRR